MKLRVSSLVVVLLLLPATAAVPAPIRAQSGGSAPAPTAARSAGFGVAYFADARKAQALYEAGDWGAAAVALDSLASRYPHDPSTWYRLGRALERLDRDEEAIRAYAAADGIGYRYGGWIPHRIAQLHGETGAADSALVWLDRALEAGWAGRPGLADDPAFASLRADPRFVALTGRPGALSRDAGWRYDIDYLVAEARRIHSGPDRPAHSPAFATAAAELKRAVPRLTNDEIVVGLRRLTALLGDGHTGIYGPGPDSPLEFRGGHLPVLLYAFDDGVHVVDAMGDARRWIGSRVLAFGDRSTGEVMDTLRRFVHADNDMTPLWLGVHFYLATRPFLHAAGAVGEGDAVTLTLRDRSGVEHRVALSAGEHTFRRKLRPPADPADPPRWLRHVDTNYWLDPIPRADALYFQFNQVRDMDGGPTIAAFADTLRAALVATGASSLVVDVRHNNGGNNGLLEPLLRTLTWWEMDAPDRRIFVITGRNTFSAAQNFITRVERRTNAVFVGEPSSSRPNFSGEETGLVLPYSRVRGSISNRYWQDSDPDDQRPWIAPDVPVTLSSDDYFDGRDPALAAILAILRSAEP
jgi:tetratricopeptide (TPR) repeat protein